MRPDLLALSPDDLAALANRGLVKRAQREQEAGELTVEWDVGADGTIRATWSDTVTCVLPGSGTVRDAKCSCGAFELCRHVLRTVLAWQHRASSGLLHTSGSASEPWDPGRLEDAALEKQVPRAVLNRAARLQSQGVLAELLRSAKPSARFHCPGHTVRFPVPDDLRYAQCSCADPAPCVHAVLAVRSFRLLAPEAASGVVSAGPLDPLVPPEVLDAAASCVEELVTEGLAQLPAAWRDRARRVAGECASASLVWPAQILEELAEDLERYVARDAVFSPAQTLERAGELLLRVDAIRAGRAPIPQAFIRGMTSDKGSELGAARLIGLGATATESRRSTRLTVFLQDCDSGNVMTLVKELAETGDSARKPFHELGRASAVKGASLAALAAGQLITQGGRRTPSGRLMLGRARAAVNPQAYAWEQLKAPVLVEDFTELGARLRLLPPASFRPRREAADFHVCPIGTVTHAQFDPSSNAIVAGVLDRAGKAATLAHPWTSRGEPGAEKLLRVLRSGATPLFVAGFVRASAGALLIRPTALVLAGEGGARACVVPWLDTDVGQTTARHEQRFEKASLTHYAAAAEVASELILNGLKRTQGRDWPGWQMAATETEERGYHRMAEQLRRVMSGEGNTAALGMIKLLALARDFS